MPRTWAWRTLAQRHSRTASTAKATIAMLVVMMNHGDATNFGTQRNVQKVAGMSPDAIVMAGSEACRLPRSDVVHPVFTQTMTRLIKQRRLPNG
eukprot:m.26949 g.26949  ORF g.26949 m.26949 type:complete len:94 (-) comp6376_c0_seq2:3369-3650(-)